MDRLELYSALSQPSDRRILFYVIDGLGGLAREPGGPTSLETARTPTLDRLAGGADCGLMTPVLPGVTPGSGPAHLALFGYDPVEVRVGRGILSALGIGFELEPGDVAARINFCTLDDEGRVVDRRAGRIDGDRAAPLADRLDGIELAGDVTCFVRHVKEYRACVVLRGPELEGSVADTDPQETGVPPAEPLPLKPSARRTADLAAEFLREARQRLAGEDRANGLLLRGFDTYRPLPSFDELYGLRAAAVASYPMYRGVARLVGMDARPADDDPEDLASVVGAIEADHDFVYVHYKKADSRGEDGDFEGKVGEIEAADRLLERLLEGGFQVVMVTGDHSTPVSMRSHSWHPVPVLIHGPHTRGEGISFGESSCRQGSLGQIASRDVLPLVLAQAGRLRKFGA